MDYLTTLKIARNQFILSLHVRNIHSFGIGKMDCSLLEVYLGPYPIDISGVDFSQAAWSMEKISTQNLAISLDSLLEVSISNRLQHPDCKIKDFCCFVRCLRNASAHDPYFPVWDLRSENYRRKFYIDEVSDWIVDLTHCNKQPVEESQYRYASGLLKLVEIGRSILPH